MNDRIQELAAEILRLRGEPARDDEHFAFAFVRHLFLSQMERAEKAEAALAEAVAKERERCAKVCEDKLTGLMPAHPAHSRLTAAAAEIRCKL